MYVYIYIYNNNIYNILYTSNAFNHLEIWNPYVLHETLRSTLYFKPSVPKPRYA